MVNPELGLINSVNMALEQIQGSYFGMLQGRWPLHLLSKTPLPEIAFRDRDYIRCRVYGYESNVWSFSPIEYKRGDDRWFKLEFNLPEEIATLVAGSWDDPVKVANIKERHFSYMILSGKIGEIFRVIKLELDQEWINSYKIKMQHKVRQGN